LINLTAAEKTLVEQMNNKAQEIIARILQADRESQVLELIDELLLIKKETGGFESAPAIVKTAPAFSRPYCEAPCKLLNKIKL